jgi:hypothetical protein
MLTRDRNLILLVRIGNLFLASLACLVMLMAEAGCHSALSSAPPRLRHGPITAWEILRDLVAVFWFAGAVGLFSHKRLAWVGSLLGTGISACFFATLLVETVALYFLPDAGVGQIRDRGDGGYIIALIVFAGEFSVLLMASLALFVGLFRMRKQLVQV